jgi:hypothetical protein
MFKNQLYIPLIVVCLLDLFFLFIYFALEFQRWQF